jgi:putative flippase GtrA
MVKLALDLRYRVLTEILRALKWQYFSGQFSRFTVIGIGSNLIGYLFYILITHFGVDPKVAMSTLYGVGVIAGFFGHGKFTFKQRSGLILAGHRYIITHLLGYLLNFAIQIVVTDRLGYPHQLAQIIGVCVVGLFLFIAFKYFVFVNSSEQRSEV